MWVCGRSLGNCPPMWALLGEQSPEWVCGCSLGYSPHLDKSCMGSVPSSLTHVSPAGRPLLGAVQAASHSSAREEPGRWVLGPAGAGPGLVTRGLFPPSGLRGQRRPRPQAGPGKEVVQSSPQSGCPSSPTAPRSRGGRAAPGASRAPLEPPQSFSHRPHLSTRPWAEVPGRTGRTRPSHGCVGWGRTHSSHL